MTDPGPLGPTHPLVGRTTELDRLVESLDEAAAGRGGVVLLGGEPGIGKTRLAEELAAVARGRGARVVWGRCPEGEGAPPFWPWVQVLRALVRDGPPDALRITLGRGAAAVAELVPEIHDLVPDLPTLPPLDPAQARFRLFDGVASFLQAIARGGALVLIVDDLHWADASSLSLLRFVATAAGDAPLLVLGTYRGDEIDAGHPLARVVADVARLPRGLHLTLHGLDAAAVVQVVEAVSVTRPSPALVAALAQDTHGNPLFVLETVRLLQAEGRFGAARGDDLWRGGIPLVVREVIARRLARLSPACQEVLMVAAVLGRAFDAAVLAAVEPATRAGLFEALGEAETARVIEAAPPAGDRYHFTHSLLRETLYEDIPRAERARLHLRAGEVLADGADGSAEAPLAELARHFFHAAALGGAARAVAYARRAADRALEQLAYEEAARLCELALRALALAPAADPSLDSEMLLILGDARTRVGDMEGGREAFWCAAEHARRVARREDAGRFLARAALGIGGFVLSLHPPMERLEALLEEALAMLGADDPLRAQALGRLAMESHAAEDDARRDALSSEAVACARRSGDMRGLAIALLVRHNAMRGPDAQALLPIAAEAVAVAEATGDAALLAWAYRLRAIDLTELGEIAAFDRDRRNYAALAERLRDPYHLWQHALWAATGAALAGRFGDAEALAGRALDLGRRGPAEVAELYYAVQIALLRLEAGRAEAGLALFRDMPRRFPALDGLPALLAVLQLAADDVAGARLTYERLVKGGAYAAGTREDLAGLRRGGMWLMTVALLAHAAVALGDTPRMTALYALLLPHGDLTVMVGAGAASLGAVSHHLGLLAAGLATSGHPLPFAPAEGGSGAGTAGRAGAEATPTPPDPWVAAERHFRAALAQHERTGAPGLLAYTRYELARLLLGWARAHGATSQAAPPWAGAESMARALLGEALADAQQLGMVRLAGLAATALEPPRPEAAVAGPATETVSGKLTVRELEVLSLLGRGASNKAIAAALVLSVRTVERHIMNLYPKIGAHNRADATAYAIHHHLV